MKQTEFVVILDDKVRKRHVHTIEKGEVVNFAVQLEVFVKDAWKTVIRYDCAHGFSHIDKYDIHGNKTKELLNLSYKNALTMADHDLNNNWKKYVNHFIKTT